MSEATAEKLVRLLVPILLTVCMGLATFNLTRTIAHGEAIAVIKSENSANKEAHADTKATLKDILTAITELKVAAAKGG